MNNVHAELDAIQMQTIINQSRIDSLESCKAVLSRCMDYLESRDDYYDTDIEKACVSIEDAAWRIGRQIAEIEDAGEDPSSDDLFREMKRDDDRARTLDILAEMKAAR